MSNFKAETTFPPVSPSDMKIEVIVLPVSDVERAKTFYSDLGWHLDLDVIADDEYRVIQFTPPGSSCSVIFGRGITDALPGSVQGLHLVVTDLVATRKHLLQRGVSIGEPFFDASGLFHHVRSESLRPGLQPTRTSYGSFAMFRDPDGNSWVIQEITVRLSGDEHGGPLRTVKGLVDSLGRAKALAEATERVA